MKNKNNSYLTRFIAVAVGLIVALGGVLTPAIANELLSGIETPAAPHVINSEAEAATPSTPEVTSLGASVTDELKAGQYVDVDMVNNQSSDLLVEFSVDGGTSWSFQVQAARLGKDAKPYSAATMVTRSWVFEAIAPDEFSDFNAIRLTNSSSVTPLVVNLTSDQVSADIAYALGSNFTAGSWYNFYSPNQKIYIDNVNNVEGKYELYNINTTFYDYYANTEVNYGWGKSTYNDGRSAWEPYPTFNSIEGMFVEAGNNWSYPLYFGNFWKKYDGYAGYPGFLNKANNSADIPNMNTAIQKLVDDKLDSNGQIQSGGVAIPLFDYNFLAENNIGMAVESALPVRMYNQIGELKEYGFNSDSTNSSIGSESGNAIVDNIWFTRDDGVWNTKTSGEWKTNYATDSKYRVYDAKENYGAGSNEVGFFPFDTSAAAGGTTQNNAYDFGLGIRSEVNFYLPAGGVKEAEELKFDYTGDDDMWVFVDDVLVLDLGGDHKKSGGTINFATKQTTYKNIGWDITNNSQLAAGRVLDFPARFGPNSDQEFNNNDTMKKHTLTIFYMERGMIESNLHFSFSLTPTDGELELEKKVNATSVNSALQSAVESNNFDFNIYKNSSDSVTYDPLSNYKYQYINGTSETKYTDENGKLTVQDGYYSRFNDAYNEGEHAKIVEANTSPMTYDTTYEMYDLYSGQKIVDSISGKSFEFQWIQLEEPYDPIGRRVVYTNTPYVSPLTVTKQVIDAEGQDVDDTTDFDFTLKLDLAAGTTYVPYELAYTKTDQEGNVTTGTLPSNGTFKLKSTESIAFAGLPRGITYQVVETPKAGYTTTAYTKTGTVGDSAVTVPYVNQIFNTAISFTKYFDSVLETIANRFTFDLYETTSGTDVHIEQKKNDANGTVTFSAFQYTAEGTHYYRIDEVDKTNPLINYGSSIYVKVVVENDGTGKLKSTVTYYSDYEHTKVLDPPKMDNSTKLGSVTIKKVDTDTATALKGAKFKLVPAKVVEGVWSDLTPTSFDDATEYEVVNDDGTLTFSDLNIGTTLPYYYQLYETVAPAGHQLLGSTVKITIDETTTNFSGTTWHYNQTITVNDAKDTVLPLTGGIGWIALGVMASIFIAAGVIIYLQTRKSRTM